MVTIYLNPKTGPNGRFYYTHSYFFATDLTDEEALDRIMNKSKFDYIAGRKVYRLDARAQKAIDAGNYLISREVNNV